MNLFRLAVRFAPVAWALVLLPAPLAPQPDPARTGEQATMRQLFQELSSVFRLGLDEAQFEDPANRRQILRSLYALAGNAEQIAAHGNGANPSTDFFGRSLVRDANEAVMRFRQGQYEGTRFLVDQLVDNCFACHSRLPSDRPFRMGEEFMEDVPLESLTAVSRARLQVAMRQFDDGLRTYERYFDSRTVPAAKLAASAAFENYLRICLRVRQDCKRAIETFARFRERPDVPPYLDTRLDRWMKDLREMDEKRERGERNPLKFARKLIRDAQYRNAFPNDPQGTVRFVAATGHLHRYLQTGPKDERRLAEACYLLGVAESYISPSLWRSQTDVLLERAIRTCPHSVYGRMALDFLEEYMVSGYTGSSGVHIPPETQERLNELRALVEAEN